MNWLTRLRVPARRRQREALSAAVDGALTPRGQAWLDHQLERNPVLQSELDELRQTVSLLRSTPTVALPRSFTLDPAAYSRVKPRAVYLFPVLRTATVVASVLFVFLLAGEVLFGAMPRAARAPVEVAFQDGARVGGHAVGTGRPPETPEAAFMMEAPAEEKVAGAPPPAVESVAVEVTREVEAQVENEPAAKAVEQVVESRAAVPAPGGADTALTAPAVGGAASPAPTSAEAAAEEAYALPTPTPALAGGGAASPTPALADVPALPAPTLAPPRLAAPEAAQATAQELSTAQSEPAQSAMAQRTLAPTAVPNLAGQPAEDEETWVAPERGAAGETEAGPSRLSAQTHQPVAWLPLLHWGAGLLMLALVVGTALARKFGW